MVDSDAFLSLRPTLFGIAYRMLGSAADADDIVQEAYLRWQRRDGISVVSPRSFLTTVVTRLCLDHLRSARVRREAYVGPWLPEPLSTEGADPARAAELAESLSLAFLVLLEELSPAERAAFILHDVFGCSYGDVADALDRGEQACRQLVSRARHHLRGRQCRFDVDRRRGEILARRFVAACATGDLDSLLRLLTDDAVVWSDGGGKAQAALRPVVGAARAARFLVNVAKRLPPDSRVRHTELNGQPGIVVEEHGVVVSAIVLDVVDDAITAVRVVVNPDKLAKLATNHREVV